MLNRLLIAIIAMALQVTASADSLEIKKVRHAGPFRSVSPIVLDSVDNAQKKFSERKPLDMRLPLTLVENKPLVDVDGIGLDSSDVHIVAFDVLAAKYLKDLKLDIRGSKDYKVYADGKEQSGAMSLQPGYHIISVKFVADSTAIALSLPEDGLELSEDGLRRFTMTDVLGTKVTTRASLSPSGRWAFVAYRWYDAENKVVSEQWLVDLKTGRKQLFDGDATWMPATDRYYFTEKIGGKKCLKAVDPLTNSVTILAKDMPDEWFVISPTEQYAIISPKSEGTKKEEGVFEIIHPDDRQPGWRTRYSLARCDFGTGLTQPLTYSYRHVSLSDISPDGRYLLFSVATDTLQQRPTTRSTYYELDMETMQTRTLVERDGFIGSATYCGSRDLVAFSASTEAFGGIGNRVPEGQTPNMFDYHLYLMDTQTLKVTPVTADDATSIEDVEWSAADKCLYYTAQNGDSVSLYRLDMRTLSSTMVRQPLEDLSGMSVARNGGNIMVHGSSMSVPYEVYNITAPAGKAKATLVMAPNKDDFAGLKLSEVKPWSFESERGYRVTGFYTLPADFDPARKYPVIVHYYGGCSPTSRRFGNGSHYPAHYWNTLGYITFIVNPSGASGFVQEWASRHVNTMGEGPAQDIIDATRQFVKDVPQCDADHIGCISASYGGFMTQYMMTKDNPFACGVSQAGISSHTSYWGEGYWGYSDSETSAANSYPWTRKDLFVERSPLYNADKITKPILFTHGTADTNVPLGESIQMYRALKLLGVPTAFIEVEGENHGIMDPVKRTKWINSIMAWFEKYLKNDDSWWNAIYTPKHL